MKLEEWSATKIRARINTVNLRNIEFLIEEAFTGIVRNGLMAFASISTIALSLGVLGAFVLAALGASNFAAAQVGQFRVAVFTDPGLGRQDAEHIADEIRKMEGVAEVTLRDRDKEWSDFKREQPGVESAGLPGNVLPYALDVKATTPDRLPGLAAKIRTMDGVHRVKGWEDFDRVITIVRAVRAVSIVGAIILLVTTAFIISNAIRLTLYARRREIRIMQLVGATNETIRIPLVLEGMVFGAAGALVALILLRLGGTYIAYSAQSVIPMSGQFSSGLSIGSLALGMIVAGTVIGAIGSLVSIRRFLRD